MKVTLTLEDDVRARQTKNGILIDLAFYVPADVVKTEFRADSDHTVADIVPDGTIGKRVHWKLSGDRWNALVKAGLAPTWYGKFECDLHDITANDFEDKDGNPHTALLGQFRPIKSTEGVAIGTTDTLEVIPAKKDEE